MRSSLTFPVIAGALLCLAAAASAQQQESRMEQILKPDPTRQFDFAKTAAGSKSFNTSSNRVLAGKNSGDMKKFSANEFLTGSFHSQKAYWAGDFKYNLDGQKSSRFLSIFPTRSYKTQAAATKEYSENKSFSGATNYKDAAAAAPTRDFRGKEREKLNKHLTPEQAANNGYRGDLNQLKSIDDVRALLNKSK